VFVQTPCSHLCSCCFNTTSTIKQHYGDKWQVFTNSTMVTSGKYLQAAPQTTINNKLCMQQQAMHLLLPLIPPHCFHHRSHFCQRHPPCLITLYCHHHHHRHHPILQHSSEPDGIRFHQGAFCAPHFQSSLHLFTSRPFWIGPAFLVASGYLPRVW
jgi:hypothetical protein